MRKIDIALTNMKGEAVAEWIKDIGKMMNNLNRQTDNVPALWDQFLYEFKRQFADSSKQDRAKKAITQHRLRNNDVDAYISEFERLSRLAQYNTGNPETTQLFLNGLSTPILQDVMRAPPVTTYEEIKERAIHSAHAQRTLQAMMEARGGSQVYRPPIFRQANQPRRPFFQHNQGYRPQTQYNSSNAPPAYNNNQPVPMDIGQSHAQRPQRRGQFRGRGRGHNPTRAYPTTTT